MANDGQIVFEVTADGKHAIADIKDITRQIEGETKKWDKSVKESTDGMDKSFSSLLKKLSVAAIGAGIVNGLKNIMSSAIEAASELEEVQNVVDVTFGDNANQVEKWAKNAGTQFGLTETQAKRFSSTMGAMLKSSGLAGEQIVDVSTDLAGLAADMASFYNLDFDTAFQKIRSGISGQTMPLKELGIDMSVATLNAFALKQGLSKTFNEMSQGEQTMLRYQYLMSATADAQGDFARTSDGYANSMRKLETNIDALKTKLGQPFLDVVSQAVGALNGFLEALMPDESNRTVLDDFADIDLKTDAKLEQIRQTAEEARLLTDQLDAIGGSKTDQAGSKIQQLATDLAGINLDQGKAGIVKDFITTLANNIGTISDLQGTDADGAKAWLEGIAESADKLDPNDAEGWETLLTTIKEGLPGIENTDFGASFFSALGSGFETVSEQSSVLQWAIDTLGSKTNKTTEEQALWLETCKRLVKTIPGLSSIINTETGEIKGGTQAVKDYIKAWEEGQTKLALLGALEQKESALSSRFADLPGLQLDMALAQRRLKQQRDKIQKLADEMGITVDFSRLMKVGGSQPNMWTPEQKEFNEAVESYYKLNKASVDATDAYNKQNDALNEAKQALIEYRQTIDEMPGTIENATDATEEWSEEAKANAQTLIDAVTEAMTALDDYVKGVRDSVESGVNSVVKGFSQIETPMMKNRKTVKDLTESMNGLDTSSKTYKEDLKKINDEIAKNNSAQISAQSMGYNLKQQAQYMEDYLANLRKAREIGVSAEILASLSDGSQESYDYLEALAKASPKEVETINAEYQKVIDKKKELTDELTSQQLTVDQTYQSLADKAKEAVAALDLEETAKENSGKTISGMAQGIADHVPEVQTAVDNIIAQLERLDGWGVDIDLGGFGNIKFTTSTGKTEGSARMGLDYVPHDDYIARLHEGEKVLSAQEASIYRGLANGSLNNVDLDSLGGVMRDNIRPGGNVYLDGKIVGAVVSDRQGRAYKQLQRSGWQA